MKSLIIPIFIPNQGCPHRCIFCEQQSITSQSCQTINSAHVERVLDKAIRSKDFDLGRKPEVAFYGGTFTRLPLYRMSELLGAVAPYLKQGFFLSIRVSTRPDALDEKRLKIMEDYGVLTVELGAQSMDDKVLVLSKRGHTAEDTVRAVETLRAHGLRVGIQLMPGLPGDSGERFRSTITEVIKLSPDLVRLYPAVVIRGTEMARLYREGRYEPLGLEEAVEICAESCVRLERQGIPVIRIGLMSSPSLLEKGRILAGPWHTAFGFLVRSNIQHQNIQNDLPDWGVVSQIKIRVSKKEVPLVRGYKNQGLQLLKRKTGAKVIRIEPDDSIPPGRIRVERI
ncbi:MAG: radical SAM protein [Desulfobacteraceae bacterium]|nr:MAG: radical SAM protein [Desulfobacteraceae bacterium]